jgi:CheY-like chemotaxis protein
MNAAKTIPPAGKILVIDDNPIIQRAVYFALRDQGYQVLMVGEVSEATKIIRRERVDLVLVDLSFPMEASAIGGPQQDGFYFINWIQRTPEITKPPIVIISSTDPAQYQERAAAAGVRACIQKPLKKETLLAAAQSILGEPTKP